MKVRALRFKIRHQLLVLILAPLALQIIVSLALGYELNKTDARLSSAIYKRRVLLQLDEIQRSHVEGLHTAFFYSISHKPELLTRYRLACARVDRALVGLRDLSRGNWQYESDCSRLSANISEARQYLATMIRTDILSYWHTNLGLLVERKLARAFERWMNPLGNSFNDVRRQPLTAEDVGGAARSLQLMVAAASLLSIGLALGLTVWAHKSLINKLSVVYAHLDDIKAGRPVAQVLRGSDELGELDRSLASASRRLKELRSFKNDITAAVSHDLRAPLTSVLAIVSLTLDGVFGAIGDAVKRQLQPLVKQCTDVINLVNDVLDLERLKAGKYPIEIGSYGVSELVETVLESSRINQNLDWRPAESTPQNLVHYNQDILDAEFFGDLEAAGRAVRAVSGVIGTPIVIDERDGQVYMKLPGAFDANDPAHSYRQKVSIELCLGLLDAMGATGYDALEGGVASTEFVFRSRAMDASPDRSAVTPPDLAAAASPDLAAAASPDLAAVASPDHGAIESTDQSEPADSSISSSSARSTAIPVRKKIAIVAAPLQPSRLLQVGLAVVAAPAIICCTMLLMVSFLIGESQRQLQDELRSNQIAHSLNSMRTSLIRTGICSIVHNYTHTERFSRLRAEAEQALRSEMSRLEALLEGDNRPDTRRVLQKMKEQRERLLDMGKAMIDASPDKVKASVEQLFASQSGALPADLYIAQDRPLAEVQAGLLQERAADLGIRRAIFSLLSASVALVALTSLVAYFALGRILARRFENAIANSRKLHNSLELSPPATGVDDLAALDRHIYDSVMELRRLEEQRGELIALLKQELCLPIKHMSETVHRVLSDRKEELSDRAVARLTTLKTELGRMLSLIEDLSLLDAGTIVLNVQRADLSSIIDAAIEAMKPLAEAKTIDITCGQAAASKPSVITQKGGAEPEVAEACGEKLEHELKADRDKILQVLVNLINNAVKFSPSGSNVLVSTRVIGSDVEISVIDKGPGIAEKDRERIFQRFDRGDIAAGERGSGLGLHICKMIVEAHAGKIGVDSHSAGGSRFWFTLPRNNAGRD